MDKQATTGERIKELIDQRLAQPVTDHEVLTAMERFGGSFASRLAKAWFCADAMNSARLRMAFPDLWEEYRKFAALNKAQKVTA
jgi:hypothetical protein